MRVLLIIFLLSFSQLFSQTLDTNTKKGFAANGYDIVAYFNNEAIVGNKEFTTKHNTINYKFSTKENLDLFIKKPEAYIPQYGGYCAYAVAVKSKKVGINPETFEVRNNKLYLFYNSWGTNTLELWQKEDTETLNKKADTNWEAIKHKK